ncbi:hypothetical protein TUN199_10291 [Pyrenophora tritici-repentis]|nr:hypothetical protein Alg130_09122 [Pyrenophora tritici-repentis]KAI0581204.1 hypothetical protein Alg215_04820 [Pyrenophora tritici-repentis]KAI0606648.1 hypothetical protein TUN205_09112 [Pyrenophora tritici-repentis]KAI0617720.1 hypothetical protein TUN199_10291 [Pyrenophora tritici-repentis]
MKSITFITILSLIAVSYADPTCQHKPRTTYTSYDIGNCVDTGISQPCSTNFPCYNNGIPCTIDGDNYAGMKRAKCG